MEIIKKIRQGDWARVAKEKVEKVNWKRIGYIPTVDSGIVKEQQEAIHNPRINITGD